MAATTLTIVAIVPGTPGRRLNRLRRLLEPEFAGGLDPHIRLVAPFAAEPPLLPLEQHCWEVGHGTAAFRLELGSPEVDEAKRGVYVEVRSGGEELVALREALLTGRYAPPCTDGEYRPRVHIARLEREEDVALAQRETAGLEPAGEFLLERIELMAQYPDGSWYERDFYTLDRAVSRP